jgi:hypothetical protein
MVDAYLAKLFGIAKATKEGLLHEVNKLRQLDPGHRHFEWNRPRGRVARPSKLQKPPQLRVPRPSYFAKGAYDDGIHNG